MVKKSVQTPFSRLTTLRKNEARPAPLTIWATGCEDGRIVCRPQVVRGPFQIVTSAQELPPEWRERLIAIPDAEDESCR